MVLQFLQQKQHLLVYLHDEVHELLVHVQHYELILFKHLPTDGY